ncbi:MAG TPA: FAD-dependent oxidoreductase [Anaeromyxobacteraceae bacterium]|nr:FAD-dependent oxidoreductase [Anaeromyxobacteraceae bacterium]
MTRIVVIGGGAAGTGAATMALQHDRSARVTLITEFEDIAYSPCGIPYVFAREIDKFDGLFLQPLSYYREMGLDLHTSTVVTRIDMSRHLVYAGEESFPFDALILCTGWEYEPPQVPGVGIEGVVFIKNIRRAMEIDKQLSEVRRVVVYKSKPLGLELITALPHRGIETHLVDEAPWLLSDFADPDMMKPVQDSLEAMGVRMHQGATLLGFTAREGRLAAVKTSDGEIPCDMAFLCTTMRPATELARSIGVKTGTTGAIVVDDHMRTSVPDVYAAGACVEVMHGLLSIPVQLLPGSFAYPMGKLAGVNAAGGDKAYQPVYVPWAIVGGKVQVGGALVSETIAKAMGMPYIVGRATGITAARYYPTHEKMHVKLLAEPRSHRVLGAQFSGGDGVKERADFMAFAIRKGTTLEELATMENVYSPPIGALNEPIALAAQAALRATNSP